MAIMEQEGKFKMVAKTMFGLEGVLAKELENMGAENIEQLRRAVSFEGDMSLLYRANYSLRTALSILKPLAEFDAKNEHELYRNVYAIKWEKYMNCDAKIYIDHSVFSTTFTHSLYAAQKTKDAICDRFRKMFNFRPQVSKEEYDIKLNLHIYENHVTISLDSSGESLHKRNYRKNNGQAPLNEVTAAGLIQLSGWQRDCNFFDPMCGSGTLLIEAAMYAYNIPAQYYRKRFAFNKWSDFSLPEWKRVREEEDKKMCDFDYLIWGSDLSQNAINEARENITFAKLHKDIELFRCPIEEQRPPEGRTLVITNPPYGERIEVEDIIALYERIGTAFKSMYEGNTAWVISSDLFALKKIGLKPSRKITVYNSNLECRFCEFDLYHGSKKASKQAKQNEEEKE